jgi:hypothetical protein
LTRSVCAAYEPEGIRVMFVVEGKLRGLMRVWGPVVESVIARQHHRRLRRNLQAS